MAVFSQNYITITCLVDPVAIVANPNVPPQNTVFMTDNNAGGGSTNEGTCELNTACHVGDQLVWNLQSQASSIPMKFLYFTNSQGDVFGAHPPQGNGTTYEGVPSSTGQETYQIHLLVNDQITYSWDPFITVS